MTPFQRLLFGLALVALVLIFGVMVADDPRVTPTVPTMSPQTLEPAVRYQP